MTSQKQGEKVVLAGLFTKDDDQRLFEEDMQEMALLCATAGAPVVEKVIQRRESPVASTFLGPGKLEEIKKIMHNRGAGTLVIDGRLSPGQVRNIEEIVGYKVIDRAQLILDIFAKHARSKEARVQVELAQMRSLYPRLTRAWTHFSQQVGGIGTVGPGEKQLEVDRRTVKKKISDLEKRLDKIEKEREVQRKSRSAIFRASLVGYTNVGKSSLLNSLCNSDVLVENQLFATLDTATRRTFIPGVGEIVVSDTVGFLRKLPHDLVASFRSTLSEVTESHLLLWVMDTSSQWIDQQYETVRAVLSTLGAEKIPRLLVFNKNDLVKDPFIRKKIAIDYPDALFVSALNKEDMRLLKERIASAVLSFEREKQVSDIILQKTRSLQQSPADALPDGAFEEPPCAP
jgi:GTP-binding protein HflX